jgi:signal transduction histidine kinase
VENLRDGVVTDPARYAEMLETQIERMEELAEDALAAARSEEAQDVGGSERVDPAAILREAVQEAHGSVEILGDPPGSGPPIHGPARLLRRALRNLLRNAEVHGAPPVQVEAGYDAGAWRITVRDGGTGFASGEVSRLAEPFQRGREAEAEQRPGSGLGLSVVRECVSRLDGRMEMGAESPSSVTLHIPARRRRTS